MQIMLDSTLTPPEPFEPAKPEALLDMLTDRTTNWRLKHVTQSLFPVVSDIQEGQVFHKNYMGYLEQAWRTHHGIVLTPDIMWYTLLCEVVSIIKEDPEHYRELFSETQEKQTIIVMTGELVVMPLDVLVDMLKKLVPVDADIFLREFTTTTDKSRMAQYAAFADMCSPYYNYSMCVCGIPKIRIEGTLEDWGAIRDGWSQIMKLLDDKHKDYYHRVDGILHELYMSLGMKDTDSMRDLWKDIFYMERCGSGSEMEVRGWWAELFRQQPGEPRFPTNFASHLAKVEYKQLNTGKEYVMNQGVLWSTVDDGFVVPEFGQIIMEKREQEVTPGLEEAEKTPHEVWQ